MSEALLAEFRDPAALRAGLESLSGTRHRPIDAFTPYRVEGLDAMLGIKPSRIRPFMLAGGVLVFAFGFALEYYSAVYAYPWNVGGRPLNSWPVFLLAPFEVAILAAAASGVVAFLWSCGLPKLHHPLFDAPHIERATQDRFFLLAEAREGADAEHDLRRRFEDAGAIMVAKARP